MNRRLEKRVVKVKSKARYLMVLIVIQLLALACGRSGSAVEVPAATAPTREPVRAASTATATAAVPVTGSRDEPLRLENLNSVAPEDVIQNMYIFGAGGGATHCLRPLENNALLEAQQPDAIVLQFCWDDPDASVRVTVASPDRLQEVFDLPVRAGDGFRYVDGFYQVDLTRRAGKYTFHLAGAQHELNFTVNFRPPKLPLVYEVYPPGFSWAYGLVGPHHRLHLAGFAPHEGLRLLVYRRDYLKEGIQFVGWQEITAGQNGQAWVEADFPVGPDDDLAISVVGPSSGEVHTHEQGSSQSDSMLAFQSTCPGTMLPRLRGRSFARALKNTTFYQQYSRNSEINGRLEAGMRIQVFDGPYCMDGGLWWYGIASDNLNGYVLEAFGQQYFLEPAP